MRTLNESSGAQGDRLPSYCITFRIKVKKIIQNYQNVHDKIIHLLIKVPIFRLTSIMMYHISYDDIWDSFMMAAGQNMLDL